MDERRRSGGEEKTKTLSAVRHVVFRTHERKYGRLRGFIPAFKHTEMELLPSDL